MVSGWVDLLKELSQSGLFNGVLSVQSDFWVPSPGVPGWWIGWWHLAVMLECGSNRTKSRLRWGRRKDSLCWLCLFSHMISRRSPCMLSICSFERTKALLIQLFDLTNQRQKIRKAVLDNGGKADDAGWKTAHAHRAIWILLLNHLESFSSDHFFLTSFTSYHKLSSSL